MLQGHCTKSNIAYSRLQLAQSCPVDGHLQRRLEHFVCRQNAVYDEDVLADADSACQTRAPAPGNTQMNE